MCNSCRKLSQNPLISKGSFTPSVTEIENEKDQRNNDRHQRKLSLLLPLSLGLNGPYESFNQPEQNINA